MSFYVAGDIEEFFPETMSTFYLDIPSVSSEDFYNMSDMGYEASGLSLGLRGNSISNYFVDNHRGQLTPIPSEVHPGGINRFGTVAGWIAIDSSYQTSAVLWKDGIVSDLNKLLPEGEVPYRLLFAQDINDCGEILGDARRNDNSMPVKAFVLTPKSCL